MVTADLSPDAFLLDTKSACYKRSHGKTVGCLENTGNVLLVLEKKY